MIDNNKFIEIVDGLWYEKATGKPWSNKILVGGKEKWKHVDELHELRNRSCGYYQVNHNNKRVMWHLLVWKYFNGDILEGYDVDHKNNIRDDCRIDNLQLLTHKNNARKQLPKTNKTGITGVRFDKRRNHYTAQIGIEKNGKRSCLYLGSFSTKEAAGEAFLQAKITLHGSESIQPLLAKGI